MNLIRFPDPPVEGAYVLPDGGYDHWILPEWGAFWRYVLTRACLDAGAAAVPPHIFDCTTSTGGTPAGHPGHAHDGGANIDRGYAMTGNPRGDYVVGPSRNAMLISPPDLLDVTREATILAIAAELDAEFNGLIMNVACDPMLGGDPNRPPGVLERAIDGLPYFSREVKERATAIINSSPDPSWDHFHHHHSHTRMYGRRDGAELEREFNARTERLLAPPVITVDARTVDMRLADLERRVGLLEAGR